MYRQISCEQAMELLQQEDVIIIDVRDNDSFEEDRIPGAIHLSVPQLQDFCETQDKAQTILLYCYRGISSQSVAQHLASQGFTEVCSLIGGFAQWKAHTASSEK